MAATHPFDATKGLGARLEPRNGQVAAVFPEELDRPRYLALVAMLEVSTRGHIGLTMVTMRWSDSAVGGALA
jgi:hypothetical protein